MQAAALVVAALVTKGWPLAPRLLTLQSVTAQLAAAVVPAVLVTKGGTRVVTLQSITAHQGALDGWDKDVTALIEVLQLMAVRAAIEGQIVATLQGAMMAARVVPSALRGPIMATLQGPLVAARIVTVAVHLHPALRSGQAALAGTMVVSLAWSTTIELLRVPPMGLESVQAALR